MGKEEKTTESTPPKEVNSTASTTSFTDSMSQWKKKAEKTLDDVAAIQNGTGNGTPVREGAASMRNFIETQRASWHKMKEDLTTKSKELQLMPRKFVSETAVLQSDLLVKMCRHQPLAMVSLTTLAVMLPSAAFGGRKTALFNGMLTSALAYGAVSVIGQNSHKPSAAKVPNSKSVAVNEYHYTVHQQQQPQPPHVHPTMDPLAKKDR